MYKLWMGNRNYPNKCHMADCLKITKKNVSVRKIGRRETHKKGLVKDHAKNSTRHGICNDKFLGLFIPGYDGTRKRFRTTSRSND